MVYGLTVEPTASLWDCPEFIASGYKLEIGHQPGAPFFMLVANLFAQLASSSSQVALMINLLSALLSAGCIFFLFLTITHLARKLICKAGEEMTWGKFMCIQSCGLVGALTYTFSDTFWFSAVEAEVYAFSSSLTALMFWLILKWEDEADTPQSDRWIVLIAYITGLSVGVHLLCLLCLPTMSFVVYFRKAKRITRWGMLKTLAAGFLLLGFILYGIIPGVVMVGGWMELLFTNVLHCAYHTGLLCYIVLLTAILIIVYWKVKKRMLKLTLACLMMILAVIFIYLIMVAQFQSLLSPFIVIFTIPLAFTGGLIALLISGQELSMMALMGFLVLSGVVVNNGIVFVDYVNQLRLDGVEKREALIETGVTRMRPILMTALTTILAMSTMVFSHDTGSDMSRGMAIVTIGGLAYATLMTLFVVPALYDIFYRKKEMKRVDLGDEATVRDRDE